MHHFTPLSGLIGGALIGLASAALMLSAGRLAGVSGILGGVLTASRDRAWRLAFIVGLIAAALIGPLLGTSGPARLSSSNLASSGRVRHPEGQWLHVRPRRLRFRARLGAFDRRDAGVHGRRDRHGCARPSRFREITSWR